MADTVSGWGELAVEAEDMVLARLGIFDSLVCQALGSTLARRPSLAWAMQSLKQAA